MEEDNRPKGFKIDFDDIPPENEEEPLKESPAPQPDRIGTAPSASRPARLAVLGACILLALLLLGYFHLSARIDRIDSSGSHQIKNLSADLQNRLDSLSKAVADQKSSTDADIQSLKKQIRRNAENVRVLRRKLADVEKTAGKVPAIGEKMDALKQSTAGLSDQLKKINDRVAQLEKNESTIGEIKSDLNGLKEKLKTADAKIDKLVSSEISQQSMDNAVKGLRDDMNRLLKNSDTATRKALTNLRERIDNLEKAMQSASSGKQQKPAASVPAHNAAPKGDKIIEQEIK